MFKAISSSHYSVIRQCIGCLAQGLSLAGLIGLVGMQTGVSHGAEAEAQTAAEVRTTEEIFRLVQDYKIGNIISQLGFAQARYYRDNQRFAKTPQALANDWPEAIKHYQVELVVEEDVAFVIARPTSAALNSFVAVAHAPNIQEPRWIETILCRSKEPIDQIPSLEVQLLDYGYGDLELICPDKFTRFPTHAGSLYVAALSRAQQAYILEHVQFSSQIENLGLNIPEETVYHTFKILLDERANGLQSVQLALPKYDGIPTYMGITMVIETEEDFWTTTTILCRSMESIGSDIVIPTRTAVTDPPVECPARFERLT